MTMQLQNQVNEMLQNLHQGDRVALARAITLVESTRQQDGASARELVRRAMDVPAESIRIGITGIPGVGKSTLIDALGIALINQGHRVAVLAIDPSSTRSGGSILGDKTRMERLATNDQAFIRPSPSSGTLGGVARRTREAIILCEAAGYNRILIETVGVGQSEAVVDQLTDINLLLMIGGTGDSLQGIKRGIMEIADLIAINKSDIGNDTRDQRAVMDLRQAIALLPPRANGQRPQVLRCSATTGQGIPELARALNALALTDLQTTHHKQKRQQQAQWWLHAAIKEALIEHFYGNERVKQDLARMEQLIHSGSINPFDAADELLGKYRAKP